MARSNHLLGCVQEHPTGEPCTTHSAPVGVPVVDLTATSNGMLAHADLLRSEALALIHQAGKLRATADYLELVVGVLHGGGVGAPDTRTG